MMTVRKSSVFPATELEKLDENTTGYTDIVEIDAGWKTVLVYLWAVCFYKHRQKKWIKLLRKKEEV